MKEASVSRQTISGKNIVKFGIPMAIGFAGISCNLVDILTPKDISTPTTIPTEATPLPTQTLEPTETPIPCDVKLFDHFAADIVSTNPSLNQEQIVSQLKTIANEIPSEVPFDSEACRGLIANPAPAHVENSSGDGMEANAPEGGFFYGSTGHERIKINGKTYDHKWKENNVYLTFVMGKPDDKIEDVGNTHFTINKFPVGHYFAAIASPIREQNIKDRQVIEKTWFAQQLWYALQGGTNCGVGCKTSTLSFIDSETNTETQWKATLTDVKNMTLSWEKIK